MSSNSMNEDEPITSLLFDNSNEDYIESYHEVNDMVPILERLSINDSDLMELSSFSTDTVTDLNKNRQGIPITSSKYTDSPVFVADMLSEFSVNQVTNVSVGCKDSTPRIKENLKKISTNAPVDNQCQSMNQKVAAIDENLMHPIESNAGKTLEKYTDSKVDSFSVEGPLDLSPTGNNSDNSKFAISEKKSEIASIPCETNPDTGEIVEISSVTSFYAIVGKVLDKFADDMASGIVDCNNSLKLSYSADISSDDQSSSNSTIIIDSPPPNTGTVSSVTIKRKPIRKIGTCVPPGLGLSGARQRRFGTSQPPTSIIADSKANSSDEDLKNSTTIGKGKPVNSRRKCKKVTKTSPRPLKNLDVKDEKERPSPSKRKKSSSETGTSEKFRKRSISEQNLETSENSDLIIRSRSLSHGQKKIHSSVVTNLFTENPTISKHRKRTNSDSRNDTRTKSKRSTSPDDAENKFRHSRAP